MDYGEKKENMQDAGVSEDTAQFNSLINPVRQKLHTISYVSFVWLVFLRMNQGDTVSVPCSHQEAVEFVERRYLF